MPARVPLFQEVFQRVHHLTDRRQVPYAAATRLALLVTGILAAQSCVLAKVAAELAALALTRATTSASLARRLRRTLNDPHLTPQTCYHPLVHHALAWPTLRQARSQIVLSLDESSHTAHIHLLRVSLTYWGGSLPLVWRIWPQNVKLPAGGYWTQMDALLAELATVLPADLPVVIVADRAFAVPNFTDRIAAYGWHWVVRLSINGQHRWRPYGGEQGLSPRIRHQVRQPGQRWKARGQVFKDAGWRTASASSCGRLGKRSRWPC